MTHLKLLSTALIALAVLAGCSTEASQLSTLVPRPIGRDTCEGPCPNGGIPTTTSTRPYFWGGTQAADCGCKSAANSL